jgi:hypothetical protein
VSVEDPRLSDDAVDGWARTSKLVHGDDPTNYDFFLHEETGELINYDPRLEPDKFEKRGVKLERFPLVRAGCCGDHHRHRDTDKGAKKYTASVRCSYGP